MSQFRRKQKQSKLLAFGIICLFVLCILGAMLFVDKSSNHSNQDSKTGSLKSKLENIFNSSQAKAKSGEKIHQDQKNDIVFPSDKDTAKKVGNDLYEVTNPDSILVHVDKNRKLPDGYTPNDLVYPNVPLNGGVKDKTKMRKEAALALEDLFSAGSKDGIQLTAVSAFRSFDRQVQLHNSYIKTLGSDWTNKFSAIPGTSEHQTGLAIDVSSVAYGNQLEQGFGDTKEGKWLAENAHRFGYIIRYPKDKVNITGYDYEPWHIRYVGEKNATYLYTHNLALEEVMEK
jgi:LAS superfamily LD-carboxypeptidase LdcB